MCRSSRLSGSARADWDAGLAEEIVLTLVAFGSVQLLQGRGDLAVVAFDRGERGVRQALGQQGRGDAEQGVADADAAIQVGQRPAGL